MGEIKFTADSTCDLSQALVKELGLETINFYVLLGNKTGRDGLDIKPETIYDFVEKNKILPKTAAPSPEDYTQLFEKYSGSFEAVIHFNLSNALSAANQNARIAAKNFKNVYVIDSFSLSTGTSLLIFKAKDMAAAGKTAEEIVSEINGLVPRVQASFVVDTLEYLHKGGRCSGLARLGATIFKIHPMLLLKKGFIAVHRKLRGKVSQVYNDYIEILHAEFPNPDSKYAFLTHADCSPEVVESVKESVIKFYKFENLYVTCAGSTITSHCGKGTLGLLFINDKNVVTEEK